jgi:hypothetical protein
MTWQWVWVLISFMFGIVVVACTKIESANGKEADRLRQENNQLLDMNTKLNNENYTLKRDLRETNKLG